MVSRNSHTKTAVTGSLSNYITSRQNMSSLITKTRPWLSRNPSSRLTHPHKDLIYQKSSHLELGNEEIGLYINLFLFIQLMPTVFSIFIACNGTFIKTANYIT